uniref:DUF4283 domain-containing protein n=1 Tax=Panagrellus redivivus TaxID=6233 RepID=A0A7E4V7X4_PANRE
MFPKAKKYKVEFVNHGWVQDLVKLKPSHKEIWVSIRHSRYLDNLFSFEADDLVKLIRRGCSFQLYYGPRDCSEDTQFGPAKKMLFDRLNSPLFRAFNQVPNFNTKLFCQVYKEPFRFEVR